MLCSSIMSKTIKLTSYRDPIVRCPSLRVTLSSPTVVFNQTRDFSLEAFSHAAINTQIILLSTLKAKYSFIQLGDLEKRH